MNILVCSTSAWNDANAYGNTMSNFFAGFDEDKFFSVFSRAENPNNKLCEKYFRITDGDIVRNFFRRERIGRAFEKKDIVQNPRKNGAEREQKLIRFIHSKNIKILHLIEELIWGTKCWENKKFKKFITDAAPDLIFTFAIAEGVNYFLFESFRKQTRAKTALFIADDVYTQYCIKKDIRSRWHKKRFKRMIAEADMVYGASEELCAAYSDMFGIEIKPLYKSCDLSVPPVKKQNKPIRMIYAGNLLYGRVETLAKLCDAIERVNEKETKIGLEIYSNILPDDETRAKLNRGGAIKLCGSRPYDEIKKKLSEADIVLHVESFEEKQILQVRYSFSTKIIDCLQSGSVFMVIGPSGISSVEYSRKINGAIVINDTDEILEQLSDLVANYDELYRRATEIRSFAKEKHDSEVCKITFKRELTYCIGGGEWE